MKKLLMLVLMVCCAFTSRRNYYRTSSPYRKYYIKYWQDRISLYSDKFIQNNGQK